MQTLFANLKNLLYFDFLPHKNGVPFESTVASCGIYANIRDFLLSASLRSAYDYRKPTLQRISVCPLLGGVFLRRGAQKSVEQGASYSERGAYAIRMAIRLSIIAEFYSAQQKNPSNICICAKFVVPLQPQTIANHLKHQTL